MSAERFGQQLMAEAHAQKRPAQIDYEAADGRYFRREPGIEFLLPDIHRTAHHH